MKGQEHWCTPGLERWGHGDRERGFAYDFQSQPQGFHGPFPHLQYCPKIQQCSHCSCVGSPTLTTMPVRVFSSDRNNCDTDNMYATEGLQQPPRQLHRQAYHRHLLSSPGPEGEEWRCGDGHISQRPVVVHEDRSNSTTTTTGIGRSRKTVQDRSLSKVPAVGMEKVIGVCVSAPIVLEREPARRSLYACSDMYEER